jgi:Phosphodiester glycosidase
MMRALLAACALLAAIGASPDPGPSVQPLAVGTLVKSHFVVRVRVVVQVEAAVFPRDRVSVGIIDYPFGGPPGATVSRSVVEHVLAAISGGYFRGGFQPAGLLVIDGAVHEPRSAPYSGVVGSTRDGRPVLTWADGLDPGTMRYAMQAGPFVVDPGGKPGIRSDDGHRQRRSLVIESADAIAVAVTSDCGLYDLMNALLGSPETFGVESVDRALNLSGGPSSGLAVRLPNGGVESVPEQMRVRSVLTIVER